MQGTAAARAVVEMEVRVSDLEKATFGNGRPGLVEENANLKGWIKGAIFGLGAAAFLLMAILANLYSSMADLNKAVIDLTKALHERGAISRDVRTYSASDRTEISSDPSITR